MPTLELFPAAGSPALTLTAWLLTYALHSTLLGGTVWLTGSLLGGRAHALRAALWKAALLGALLTASLQVGLGLEPAGGRLGLAAASATADRQPIPAAHPDLQGRLPISAHGSSWPLPADPAGLNPTGEVDPLIADEVSRLAISPVGATAGLPGSLLPPWLTWSHLLLALWLAGATAGLARLVVGRLRFLRRIAPRRSLSDSDMLDAFRRLQRRAGLTARLRLTVSDRLGSPVALGRREICMPRRALSELSRRQQEGMLAHEMAHLARRDPLWLWLAGIVEALFFFQPLHRVGRRHLQDSSEFLCDEWAVRHTGRSLSLARCLARVASWLERPPQPALLAPMARLGSPLVRRVQRLVEEGGRSGPGASLRVRTTAAILPLALVAALAPAISETRPEAPRGPSPEAPSRAYRVPAVAPHPEPVLAWSPDEPAEARFGSPAGRSNWIWNDDGMRLAIETDGEVRLDEATADSLRLSPGGTLRIESESRGRRRLLVATGDDNGLPAYSYRVDGREQPFEPEGRQLLEESLSHMRRQRAMKDAQRADRELLRAAREAQRAEMDRQREARVIYEDELRAHRAAMADAEREMREQDRELSRQQRESSQEALDATQRAEELLLQAEQTAGSADPGERESARQAVAAARRELERARARMQDQREDLDLQRDREHRQQLQELERLQQELEASRAQSLEERQRMMEEHERALEDLKRQLERQQREPAREAPEPPAL